MVQTMVSEKIKNEQQKKKKINWTSEKLKALASKDIIKEMKTQSTDCRIQTHFNKQQKGERKTAQIQVRLHIAGEILQ